MKRLGLIIIGDEILAGHTQDTNTYWLARRAKQMGIRLARVEVCTDDLADIEATVRRFFEDLDVDYIVTSGGLGPTHDDRTMEGIAAAVGRPLELTAKNMAWMEERVRIGHELGYFANGQINEGMRKMAYLPAGAAAMPNHLGTCLGAIVAHNGRTLFTLPGVPAEFERMFDESVGPRMEGSEPDHVEELILYTEESRLYEIMRDTEADFDDVSLGSYPQRGFIILRGTGPQERVAQMMARLREAGGAYLKPSGRFQGKAP